MRVATSKLAIGLAPHPQFSFNESEKISLVMRLLGYLLILAVSEGPHKHIFDKAADVSVEVKKVGDLAENIFGETTDDVHFSKEDLIKSNFVNKGTIAKYYSKTLRDYIVNENLSPEEKGFVITLTIPENSSNNEMMDQSNNKNPKSIFIPAEGIDEEDINNLKNELKSIVTEYGNKPLENKVFDKTEDFEPSITDVPIPDKNVNIHMKSLTSSKNDLVRDVVVVEETDDNRDGFSFSHSDTFDSDLTDKIENEEDSIELDNMRENQDYLNTVNVNIEDEYEEEIEYNTDEGILNYEINNRPNRFYSFDVDPFAWYYYYSNNRNRMPPNYINYEDELQDEIEENDIETAELNFQ